MRIMSHRGRGCGPAENTMAAFRAVERAGAHGIETDLRHTRDAQVALFHDHDVDGVPVSSMTLDELRRRTGVAVPTIEDVHRARWNVEWNLEIKTVEAYALAVPMLWRWRTPLLVSSFIHEIASRAARTGLRAAFLTAQRPLAAPDTPNEEGVSTMVWDWRTLDPEHLRTAAERGWTNLAYGVPGGEIAQASRTALEAIIVDDVEACLHPET